MDYLPAGSIEFQLAMGKLAFNFVDGGLQLEKEMTYG
jgi:hypothetical protein